MQISKLPPSGTIIADLDIEEGGKIHKFFTETCKDAMIPFIPTGDTGLLRENGKVSGADEIYYTLPYAHYQYIGMLYVMPENGKGAFYSEDYGFWSAPGVSKIPTTTPLEYHTPGTGSYWDTRMWASKGEDVIKTVQEKLDRS